MKISEAWENSDREEQQKREAYTPVSLGYCENACNNPDCGRSRVIEYRTGKKVCEKCHWDQDANDCDFTHLDMFR